MVHPVQSVIESLYAAGRCPRLHVNAAHDAVDCPDEIKHQWKERLIIDLDSSYPLDLTFGATGISANLAFSGIVTRCSFPWEAIYVVMDRATGRGIVLDRHVPESVRRQSGAAVPALEDAEPVPERPELRAISNEPDPVEAGETDPNAPAEAAPAADAAAALDLDAAPAEPEKPATDETQVKKRRAAFRVIDGGG